MLVLLQAQHEAGRRPPPLEEGTPDWEAPRAWRKTRPAVLSERVAAVVRAPASANDSDISKARRASGESRPVA